jgi:hypothetical protein
MNKQHDVTKKSLLRRGGGKRGKYGKKMWQQSSIERRNASR